MNTRNQTLKTGFPFKTVFLTVIITLIVTIAGANLLGVPLFTHTQKNDGKILKSADADTLSGETLYTCGMHPWVVSKKPGNCPICGMKLTPKLSDKGEKSSKERKIAYWRAPMNPTETYDHPGKSAMGMDLVPVYEDEVSGGPEIKIDPVTQQNMGVRTAVVEKGPLVYTIRTYGHITYDETLKTQINPKFNGWLKKLYVNYTGQIVNKGQPLFDIYSPDLINAQGDFLDAYKRQLQKPSAVNRKLLSTVKSRLAYFDIHEDEIKAIEKTGVPKQYVTIRSPFNGIVTKNNAVQGGYVKAGTTVYEIADLSRVWVEAHIYEYELPQIKTGLDAEMTLPYLPGQEYHGKVAYIYPYLERQVRDVVIRLEFENPDLKLKPDMYADVYIRTTPGGEGLIIPSEAVIRSGERDTVFVTRGDGKFLPRKVSLGMSLDDGKVQVLSGLAQGDVIVTSGQFLLDSESNLREATQKMLEPTVVAEKGTKPGDQADFFNDLEKDK